MLALRNWGGGATALLLACIATAAAAPHRLDRAEYASEIHELFDISLDVSFLLPPDETNDRIGAPVPPRDVLPPLLAAYRQAAEEVGRVAVGRAMPVRQATFRIPDENQDSHADGLPFGTRGGARFEYVFPADGTYDIRTFPEGTTSERLQVLLDGEPVNPAGPDVAAGVRAAVKIGPHAVGVTFFASQVAPSLELEQALDLHPRIDSVRIDGPLPDAPATDSPSRRRIFVCQPKKPREEKSCARRIIATLADRAYRGKATRGDRKTLLGAYEAGASRGGFEDGIEAVVQRALTDAKFIYRIEPMTRRESAGTATSDIAPRKSPPAGMTVDPGPALTGVTALMLAARTGDLAAMRALLDAGADIKAKETRSGTTALMWAAAASHPQAVRLLIDAGADVSAGSRSSALAPGPDIADSAAERLDAIRRGGEAARPTRAAPPERGGGLTALVFAAREGDVESATLLLKAGADVNQLTRYGWSPLLTAVYNRHYQLAKVLLDAGANPNLANQGGWNALYLATDNRNIERTDRAVPEPDMDHLEMIRLLLAKGANVNARMKSSTGTRTGSTQQWLHEEGATALLRAAQSGDLDLVKLLLSKGADPKIDTELGVTPLMVAAGIGWVEGVSTEWSNRKTLETLRLLIERGANVNAQDRGDGRTALMGAAHKGNDEAVRILVAAGARLDTRDIGSRDSIGKLAGKTWQAIDYADGLVRVAEQPAIPHRETAALIRRLMKERNLAVPPDGRTLDSI